MRRSGYPFGKLLNRFQRRRYSSGRRDPFAMRGGDDPSGARGFGRIVTSSLEDKICISSCWEPRQTVRIVIAGITYCLSVFLRLSRRHMQIHMRNGHGGCLMP
jgi:hypothetical protein